MNEPREETPTQIAGNGPETENRSSSPQIAEKGLKTQIKRHGRPYTKPRLNKKYQHRRNLKNKLVKRARRQQRRRMK